MTNIAGMYPFHKVQLQDNSWKFELDDIRLVMEGFCVMEDQHWMINPARAIAFFTIEGNLYGLSNHTHTRRTAEELYDVMFQQYAYFNTHPFSEAFLREHGFIPGGKGWRLEVDDRLTLHHDFEYRPGSGWYYNGRLLTEQPHHIGDLMHLYMEKTGAILKRIS
jgi:hypothetical protein